MDGNSSTDSEQDLDSSSGSDWISKMEKSKEKQGGKRKIKEQDDKEKETYSKKKKKASKSSPDLEEIFQEARNKTKLTIQCGKMTGLLYRKRYENGEKCISCKGHWFTPRHFEKFGGKGNSKKWKSSIYYKSTNGLQQVQLERLILNRCLPQYGYLRKSSTQNRREPVNSTETVSKKITELLGSAEKDRDSPAHATDATEPAVSSVVEEADQITDKAALEEDQLNFSDSPAEWQKPVAPEETEKTGQMQLFGFLANQFNTINSTLKSIDLSLKKLVEKQSENTLPQFISLTPAVIENLQIHSSVKEEQITDAVMSLLKT
ncbi:uncharacterized protein [Garra rufa]|uniref:uncharacterized protein n=1 Tax=Garra rufa TaxID=137080 RepID=UPI003CCECAC5